MVQNWIYQKRAATTTMNSKINKLEGFFVSYYKTTRNTRVDTYGDQSFWK